MSIIGIALVLFSFNIIGWIAERVERFLEKNQSITYLATMAWMSLIAMLFITVAVAVLYVAFCKHA